VPVPSISPDAYLLLAQKVASGGITTRQEFDRTLVALKLAERRAHPPLEARDPVPIPDSWYDFPEDPQALATARAAAQRNAQGQVGVLAKIEGGGIDLRELTGYSPDLAERHAAARLRPDPLLWLLARAQSANPRLRAALQIFYAYGVEEVADALLKMEHLPVLLERTPEWNAQVDWGPLTRPEYDSNLLEAFEQAIDAVTSKPAFVEAFGGPRFRGAAQGRFKDEAGLLLQSFALWPNSETLDPLVNVPLQSELFREPSAESTVIAVGELWDVGISAVLIRELSALAGLGLGVELHLGKTGIEARYGLEAQFEDLPLASKVVDRLADTYLMLRAAGYPLFMAYEEMLLRLRNLSV
jgi:hypothetical protein